MNDLPIPAAEDELPHPLPLEDHGLPWKDTWWFGLRDEDESFVAAFHITLSPNRRPGCRTSVVIRDGDRDLVDVTSTSPVAGPLIGTPVLGLEIVEPAWDASTCLRLRVRHDQVTADLEVTGCFLGVDLGALAPGILPAGYHGQLLHHAEQAVRFQGEVRWTGGPTRPVAGRGFRDRSWGLRKSERMFSGGTLFGGLHLEGPEPAGMGLLAWRHPDVDPSSLVPAAAWWADDQTIVGATSGRYLRGGDGRPSSLELHFSDGRSVVAPDLRNVAEILYSFFEPDLDGTAIAITCFDHHVRSDQAGMSGILNHGDPFLADALRHSEFVSGRT